MKWLRNQTREKIKYEQKLRKDIRDALTSSEGDRKYLLQELARREEVLDELAAAKQGMITHAVIFLSINSTKKCNFLRFQLGNNVTNRLFSYESACICLEYYICNTII